jgi:hypothetical protein
MCDDWVSAILQGFNIPGLGSLGTTNATTASKAAVPQSANATTVSLLYALQN